MPPHTDRVTHRYAIEQREMLATGAALNVDICQGLLHGYAGELRRSTCYVGRSSRKEARKFSIAERTLTKTGMVSASVAPGSLRVMSRLLWLAPHRKPARTPGRYPLLALEPGKRGRGCRVAVR